jgi:hypothetical protein
MAGVFVSVIVGLVIAAVARCRSQNSEIAYSFEPYVIEP